MRVFGHGRRLKKYLSCLNPRSLMSDICRGVFRDEEELFGYLRHISGCSSQPGPEVARGRQELWRGWVHSFLNARGAHERRLIGQCDYLILHSHDHICLCVPQGCGVGGALEGERKLHADLSHVAS